MQDTVDSGAGAAPHLIVGGVLDWVGHVDPLVGDLGHTESVGLMTGRLDELARRDHDRRDVLRFVVDQVVHTARRAGASIGEGLDHRLASFGDLGPQVCRRWLGEGGLGKAHELHVRMPG